MLKATWKPMLAPLTMLVLSARFAPTFATPQPAPLPSPVKQPDGHVTFAVFAPKADHVTLIGDYPLAATVPDRKEETPLTR